MEEAEAQSRADLSKVMQLNKWQRCGLNLEQADDAFSLSHCLLFQLWDSGVEKDIRTVTSGNCGVGSGNVLGIVV